MESPEIDYLWEGTAWINTSFLPEIYDLGENAYAIQACNGRGISINSAIGREMATALATNSPDALSITPRTPVPVRMHALASLMPKALMSLAYLSN
jgi:glycine/D-amino acid oxidase-like deaminating enzyme